MSESGGNDGGQEPMTVIAAGRWMLGTCTLLLALTLLPLTAEARIYFDPTPEGSYPEGSFEPKDVVIGWSHRTRGRSLPEFGLAGLTGASEFSIESTLIFADGTGLSYAFPKREGTSAYSFRLPQKVIERLLGTALKPPLPTPTTDEFAVEVPYEIFVGSGQNDFLAAGGVGFLQVVHDELEKTMKAGRHSVQRVGYDRFRQLYEHQRDKQLTAWKGGQHQGQAGSHRLRAWGEDALNRLRWMHSLQPLPHESKGPGPSLISAREGVIWRVVYSKAGADVLLLLNDGRAFSGTKRGIGSPAGERVHAYQLSTEARSRVMQSYNRWRFFEFPEKLHNPAIYDGNQVDLFAATPTRKHQSRNYMHPSKSHRELSAAVAEAFEGAAYTEVTWDVVVEAVRQYCNALPEADHRRQALQQWLLTEPMLVGSVR